MLLLRHFDGKIQPEGCRIVAHAIVEQNKKGKVSVKGRVRAASARARWAATY